MSTFSPNLQIEEVARNGDVGTRDTPTREYFEPWRNLANSIGAGNRPSVDLVQLFDVFQSAPMGYSTSSTKS